ncbi:hypothetical protein O2K51_12685 [Apibacter raozihei]|uniref:hypothetical protein n=1 Tax=Apibacter TaxID=1778601 RepID=UPI000FE3CE47|nr:MULTISPECIES: hypothetical protein [Apibacter]
MKIKYIIQCISVMLVLFFMACNKGKYYEGEKDPDKIKGYKNENYYTSGKMDSTQVIAHITEQKLQEVYDLAILAAENKSNKDIDTLLLSQLQGYFPKGDTLYVAQIVNTLDSLKVKYVKVELNKQMLSDTAILNDSIGKVQFKAHYYDRNKKYFSTQEQQADYILKKNPEKFKAEFKFYFSSIGKAE